VSDLEDRAPRSEDSGDAEERALRAVLAEHGYEAAGDYLFDPLSEPHAEVAVLERLLRPYAHAAPAARPSRRLARWILPAAAAVVLALLGGTAVLVHMNGEPQRHVAGARQLVDPLERRVRRAASGDEIDLARGAAGERLEVGAIGWVDVDPGTRLRVLETQPDSHELYLDRGSVTAMIYTTPRAFRIGTPAGLTVDLGCKYRVEVKEGGETRLHVLTGQVAFETEGRKSWVPRGATCSAWPGRGPSAPWWEGEVAASFVADLLAVEFTTDPDPERVDALLAAARARDSLTLWHLLRSPSTALRTAALDRLASLCVDVRSRERAALLNADGAALEDLKSDLRWRYWY
jgi:hypothetical protein